MIIDTHCHLDDERFDDDLDDVLSNALNNGVKKIIIPGADMATLDKACSICEKFENIYFAAGIHPYHLDNYDFSILEEFAKHPKCVAIGECGLDYYRMSDFASKELADENKKLQKDVFIAQIKLSIKLQKPLIAHIRDANEDSFEILSTFAKELKGAVLHCFNASSLLLKLKEFGFYFGIGGVLTFKNAKNLVNILPQIPLERLLIETDAPYLTPEPYRGKRNEPAYTKFVVEKISSLLNISVDEIENITTNNAEKLFAFGTQGEK